VVVGFDFDLVFDWLGEWFIFMLIDVDVCGSVLV